MNDTVKLSRKQIRDQLLGKKHRVESKIVTLWGVEVELRQATLKDVLAAQASDDAEVNAVNMFVRYAYVPGTDERVFEDTDRDVILSWPFGDDMMRLQNAITELTGVDVAGTEEELKDSPLKG